MVCKDVYKRQILYQEQVMKIANIMAGYSLGEADLLRRAEEQFLSGERGRYRENTGQNEGCDGLLYHGKK